MPANQRGKLDRSRSSFKEIPKLEKFNIMPIITRARTLPIRKPYANFNGVLAFIEKPPSLSDLPSIRKAKKVTIRAITVINIPPTPYLLIELNGSTLNRIKIRMKEMGNSRAELSLMNLVFIIK